MKAIAVHLGIDSQTLFRIKEYRGTCFSTDYHYHSEFQLNHIVQGSGRRIIGDSIETFACGDITLVGSDMPHVWQSQAQTAAPLPVAHSRAVYFSPTRLIEYFAPFSAGKEVENWLMKMRQAAVFHGQTRDRLAFLLRKLHEEQSLAQAFVFLEIMRTMIGSDEYTLLNSQPVAVRPDSYDNQRIRTLTRFVGEHFRELLSVEEAASTVSLNKHAFCRFFKARMGKTFTQYVNEIRISHACRLLRENDWNIEVVAFDCGFNNLSHFNRHFKRLTGVTPKTFRDRLRAARLAVIS